MIISAPLHLAHYVVIASGSLNEVGRSFILSVGTKSLRNILTPIKLAVRTEPRVEGDERC